MGKYPKCPVPVKINKYRKKSSSKSLALENTGPLIISGKKFATNSLSKMEFFDKKFDF